jgi:hypothetical protein
MKISARMIVIKRGELRLTDGPHPDTWSPTSILRGIVRQDRRGDVSTDPSIDLPWFISRSISSPSPIASSYERTYDERQGGDETEEQPRSQGSQIGDDHLEYRKIARQPECPVERSGVRVGKADSDALTSTRRMIIVYPI